MLLKKPDRNGFSGCIHSACMPRPQTETSRRKPKTTWSPTLGDRFLEVRFVVVEESCREFPHAGNEDNSSESGLFKYFGNSTKAEGRLVRWCLRLAHCRESVLPM